MTRPWRPATLAQASRNLNLPKDWLLAEARAGRLPCIIAGEKVVFDLEQLRKVVFDRARQAGDAAEEVPACGSQ